MPKTLKPPPEGWDPATVKGVREPLKITGFGIKQPLDIQTQIRDHNWKYAAGNTGDKTQKQAAAAHRDARYRVWNLEMAERARLVDEDNRTDEQKAAFQKVYHPWAYMRSRKGNSCGPTMIPPPATWRPELVGEKRTERWRYAAELKNDGIAKTAKAHEHARRIIIRDARVDEAKGKKSCDRTPDDHTAIKEEKDRKAETKQRNATHATKRQQEKQDVCNAFLEKHPELLAATDKPLTEEEAFDIAFKLFDDKDSVCGKDLFDALGSNTLRQALYEPNPSSAIYVGVGRFFGDESYRFLVQNSHCPTTVLTRMDGINFKARDQDYKNLELVSIPIGFYRSWSDCTAVEAALQLILDDLEVGSQRLWLRSGVGRDRRQLRVRDANYIEKLKAKGEDCDLTFVCFITILKNVEVISRCQDTVTGNDVVESIKAGSGTICRVHQPKKPSPICKDPAQKAALDATRLKLGFNFIDHSHKRKLDELLRTENEEQRSSESEDEESSSESEDEEIYSSESEDDEMGMGCA
jgi:hypothetical protein